MSRRCTFCINAALHCTEGEHLISSCIQWSVCITPSRRCTTSRGVLTRKPLLYESVHHRWEIPRLRLTDNLDASAFLLLPVQVRRLHAVEEKHTHSLLIRYYYSFNSYLRSCNVIFIILYYYVYFNTRYTSIYLYIFSQKWYEIVTVSLLI